LMAAAISQSISLTDRAWTSTTGGAKVVEKSAPPDGAVTVDQDGEELRSWT